jgi:hypothetical protein
MSQMKRDLERRIGERLRQWVDDSENLFDAGQINSGLARMAIVRELITALSITVARWTRQNTDAEVIETFRQVLKSAREELKQKNRPAD